MEEAANLTWITGKESVIIDIRANRLAVTAAGMEVSRMPNAFRTVVNQQPEAVGADHPLRRARRRRGLTQIELADLAGVSFSYISMVETGRRKLARRDYVNALAAVLRVAPAEIAPSMAAGSDEWVAGSPAAATSPFPALSDEITLARHRALAAEFAGYAARGDMYAAGVWLRRLARNPAVSPWLLLDQLIRRRPGLLAAPASRQTGAAT